MERHHAKIEIMLGQILKQRGLITGTQLVRALDHQKLHGGKLGHILVDQGIIEEDDLTICLQEQWQIPLIDFERAPISPQALKLIPPEFLCQNLVMPITFIKNNSILVVAMENPKDHALIEKIFQMTTFPIKPMLAGRFRLTTALATILRRFPSETHPYV